MPNLGGYEVERVVLKISGEALKSADDNINPAAVTETARQVCRFIHEYGIQTALVVGAGNILRGVAAETESLARNTADAMGMMGTIVNALALRDSIEALGTDVEVQSPWGIPGVCTPFDARRSETALHKGQAVILGGGTGHPYFTTDTTAALRACEINADAVLKATKVNGIFSDDPEKNAGAARYRCLSFDDAVQKRLKIMDATAFALCRENGIPVVVFNFAAQESLDSVLNGKLTAATLVGDVTTDIDQAAANE